MVTEPRMHAELVAHCKAKVLRRGVCYDEGKRAAETLLCDYRRLFDLKARLPDLQCVRLRMLENDGRVISNFVEQALRNEPVTIYSDGSQTRPFCYLGIC
jgi:UDP-glucuronate decarboxylase